MRALPAVLLLAIVAVAAGAGCGGGPSCSLPSQWSSVRSGDGSTCQVNIFTTPEHSVFCGGSSGSWQCACGPAAESPMEFTSPDFCELDEEERVCQAIARCGFSI